MNTRKHVHTIGYFVGVLLVVGGAGGIIATLLTAMQYAVTGTNTVHDIGLLGLSSLALVVLGVTIVGVTDIANVQFDDNWRQNHNE